MDLSEKVALVTGAARGIGKGCVEELLLAGIKGVTIADINKLGEETTKELNDKYGSGKVMFVETDVVKKDSFENAFQRTVDTFGNIDILINNAGLMNEINWEISIQVNLVGTINGILLAIEKYFPQYKSGEKSFVLNLSSIAGITPAELCPIYAGTKYGVIGLTRTYGLNRHLRKGGIHMMALCPGSTDTTMIDYMGDIVKYKYAFDELMTDFHDVKQQVSVVGKAAIQAMIDSESGSAYFIEGGEIYKVNFPSLEKLIGKE